MLDKVANHPNTTFMKQSEQQQTNRFPVYMNEQESARFRKYLESTGRKAGPYLRHLAMREVETWEAIQSNATQLDDEELAVRFNTRRPAVARDEKGKREGGGSDHRGEEIETPPCGGRYTHEEGTT
jgi:hypothetical protein